MTFLQNKTYVSMCLNYSRKVWNLEFKNFLIYLLEVTFQIVFPLSSFTKSDPSGVTVTATGRP
jgi:hypothetical protein